MNKARMILPVFFFLSLFDTDCAGENAMAVFPSDRDTTAPNEISIDNFAFNPKILTAKAGSKVTWRNRDDTAHKIQSSDNRFQASPVLDTKGLYSVDFREGGEFPYFCSIHPVMQGKIVVAR